MYAVELSATAEKKYRDLCEAANHCLAMGDEWNSNVAVFRTANRLIDEIIARTPFEKGRELCHPFFGVYMISSEGLHIFYTASPRKKLAVVVLSISSAPKVDAYLRAAQLKLTELVNSGKLDHRLARLFLRRLSQAQTTQPRLPQ